MSLQNPDENELNAFEKMRPVLVYPDDWEQVHEQLARLTQEVKSIGQIASILMMTISYQQQSLKQLSQKQGNGHDQSLLPPG